MHPLQLEFENLDLHFKYGYDDEELIEEYVKHGELKCYLDSLGVINSIEYLDSDITIERESTLSISIPAQKVSIKFSEFKKLAKIVYKVFEDSRFYYVHEDAGAGYFTFEY